MSINFGQNYNELLLTIPSTDTPVENAMLVDVILLMQLVDGVLLDLECMDLF
jgi:hypothetical protein